MSDINSYIWKDARFSNDKNEKQLETRLVDMEDYQLQMVYSHCKEMLYNTDYKNEGRMIIIDQINKQLEACNAELAHRWFKTLVDSKTGNYLYTSDSLLTELRSWIKSLPDYNSKEKYTLKEFVQVPSEFKDVSIDALMNACRDNLGFFNHSKITYSFLYTKLGIYLTQEELKEIDKDLIDAGLNPEKITLQAKIENHIKTPLSISNEVKINPKGLTGSEFTDMIRMKKLKGYKVCKYSNLSTAQLKTLHSKVLYALEERTLMQAKKWKEIMGQIEEVAKYKNYVLN